jgi:hypothetical protein
VEYLFAGIALLFAAWQLHLQRQEIQKGNEIERRNIHLETLRAAADLLKTEIDLREKIIADKKAQDADWKPVIEPHVNKVNKVLRPRLHDIQLQIINGHGGDIDALRSLTPHLYAQED